MSRIARRTGVTQPLINHHFGTKRGLWRAVLEWIFEDVRAEYAGALNSELPLRRQVLEMARQTVYVFARRPELARIVNTETNHPSEAFDELSSRYLEPVIALTQGVMHRAIEEGVLRPDADPRHLHFVIVGAAMQPFTEPEIARRAFGLEPFSEDFIERHADNLCAMVEAGLLQEPD